MSSDESLAVAGSLASRSSASDVARVDDSEIDGLVGGKSDRS